jgi:predicted amidohydrolase
MKVAGIQMDIAWEDPEENFRRARILAREAASRLGEPPFLLAFPEMFATGFSMRAEAVAAAAPRTREVLSGIASEWGAFVLGGYAEPGPPEAGKESGRPANACSIFSPDGSEVLHYRKIHPFSLAGEAEHYQAGDTVVTADLDGIRVTPLICYDLRFPEAFRGAAVETDLYVVIANWPRTRREHWTSLLEARAIENQAYVLGVNRGGEGDGLVYTGDSVLRDPMGKIVAGVVASDTARLGHHRGTVILSHGNPDGVAGPPGFVLGEVEPQVVAELRGHLSFLEDRRPQVYQRLERGMKRAGG